MSNGLVAISYESYPDIALCSFLFFFFSLIVSLWNLLEVPGQVQIFRVNTIPSE